MHDGFGLIITVAEAVLVAVELPKFAVAVTVLVVVPAGKTTPEIVQVLDSPAVNVKEHEAFPAGNVPQAPFGLGGTTQKSSAGLPGVPLSSTSVTDSVTVLVLLTV